MSAAIYSALKANDLTVIGLAKDIGVTRSVVYQSIDGYGSRSIRVRLALLVGKPPTTIWGHCHQYQLDDLFYEKKAGV
jgi:hypothetical protein